MSKTSKVADKGSKASKALNKVKDAGVTKASSSPAAKSKTIAAKVASKEKSSKKSKKEPTPSSSESESESDEDMKDASSSSSESESEDEKPAPKKAEKKVAAKKAESSDSSDSSDSESESEEEKPAPKKAEKKVVAKKDESSDSSDSSDSESEEEKPAPKKTEKKAAAKAESSDSSDSDSSESEAEAKKAESSDSDSDSDSSDSDSEASEPSKKRKADDEPEAVAKKSKTEEVPEGASANLFIGNLSWNVDEEWLQREFSEFGELSGCRIVTDRESGRSRGFGYVEFVNAADAVKAMDAKKGTDLDGRTINLDYATARAAPQAGADRTQNRARSYGDSTSPESDTLFVGNLPFSATEDALHEVFGAQGSVLGIRLPTEQETGRPKGFGYVQFASIDEAKAAHSALNGEEIEGRAIRLDFSTPRPPRENGGGFGGGRGGGGRGGGRGGFGGRGGGGGFGGRGGGGRGGGRGGFGAPRGGALNKGKGSIPEFKGSKVTF
ncbi:unnamed protein product [Penicillium bialowiezense]